MKKIIIVVLMLLCLFGCSNRGSEADNTVANLINDGYEINCSTFDENRWKGLLCKDSDYLIVEAKLNSKQYDECNEVFFESDKYQEFVEDLEVSNSYSVSDKLPSEEELNEYVGKTFGELEDEGFENTGYCESDNYQYNFTYESSTICISVKSSADTPIYNMDDFSVNDIRELVIEEVVDCYLSSNILYEE